MRRYPALLLALATLALFAACAPSGAQAPGPSQALFDSPYYTCVRNFYVATTGSNSNSGTSPSAPWKTIKRGNASSRTGGEGSNVAPGTGSSGAGRRAGGRPRLRLAMSSIAARPPVQTSGNQLRGGGITEGEHGFEITGNETANYVISDGFTMTSASAPQATYGQGIGVAAGSGAEGFLCGPTLVFKQCHHPRWPSRGRGAQRRFCIFFFFFDF